MSTANGSVTRKRMWLPPGQKLATAAEALDDSTHLAVDKEKFAVDAQAVRERIGARWKGVIRPTSRAVPH